MLLVRKEKLADFVRLCEHNQVFRTFVPNEDFKLNFTNWKNSKKCLFSIYVEFGVILVDSRTNSVLIEFFYHGRDYQWTDEPFLKVACLIWLLTPKLKFLSEVPYVQQQKQQRKKICRKFVGDCQVIRQRHFIGKFFALAHSKLKTRSTGYLPVLSTNSRSKVLTLLWSN